MRIAVLATLLTVSLGGAAQANPLWLQHPNADDIQKVYPRAAQPNRDTGVVELVCKVNAESRLEDCKIGSETPPDLGFGEAALKLAPKFKMRKTVNGKPVAVGTEATVPIRFGPL